MVTVYIIAGPESRLLRLKEPLHRSQVNPRSNCGSDQYHEKQQNEKTRNHGSACFRVNLDCRMRKHTASKTTGVAEPDSSGKSGYLTGNLSYRQPGG